MSKSIRAARTSAAAALVEHLPAAPNAHTAPEPKVSKPVVDQAIVDSYINAEGAVGDAAVALFYACIAGSVTLGQFTALSPKTAGVRVSEFNTSGKVAKRLGAKGTRGIILQASKKPGDKRGNVLAALRIAKKTADELKPSALKGAALSKEVTKRAEAAARSASDKDAERSAARRAPRQPQGPAVPKADSLGAYVPTMMAAFAEMQKQLGKLTIPARMLGKVRDLSAAIEEAGNCAAAITYGDAK